MKIKLNKTDFECSFGLGFLGEVIENLDIDYGKLMEKYEKNPIKYVPLLMYYSVIYDMENVDFTQKEFFSWIDNEGGLSNEYMIKWSHAFIESINKNAPKTESKGDTSKKK